MFSWQIFLLNSLTKNMWLTCIYTLPVRADGRAPEWVQRVQGAGDLRHLGGCQRQHSHHGLHGRFQATRRHSGQARAQVSHKIWCNEFRHKVINTTSPWTSWAPSGSSPRSAPGRISGQSQNIWRHKFRHDVSDNTLRLLTANQTSQELWSDSQHDVTSSDRRHQL